MDAPKATKEASTESGLEAQPADRAVSATGDQDATIDPHVLENANSRSFQIRLGLAILLPVFLETLDYTVVATAQTHIASQFNRLDLQSYIGTAYVLTSTVFLPIFASLADIFGRHFALQLAIIIFMVGSAISTGANGMIVLLVGRGVAGVGAAGLVTVVRILLADFRSLNTSNWQAAMLTVLYAVGFSVGPVIGGALSTISFRWVFAINLPCCVLSIALVYFLLRGKVVQSVPSRHSRAVGRKETYFEKFLRVDLFGGLLFIAAGIMILLGLNWGSTSIWNSARVITTLVLGGLLTIAFIFWEIVLQRYEDVNHQNILLNTDPIIAVEVFRNFDLVATSFAAFTSGMVMLVCFYFVSIFFVLVAGLSATQAGVQLIFFAPGMGLGTIIAIRMIAWFRQPKYPIIFGTFLLPIALGLISMALEQNKQASVDGFMAMAGVGVGMTFAPLALQARYSLPERRVALSVGLNLFFRTLGGTIGIAQCAAVLNAKVQSFLINLAETGVISPQDVPLLASSSLTSAQQIDALPDGLGQHIKDAFRDGTHWSFVSLVPWCGIAAVLVLFLRKIADTDAEKREHEKAQKEASGEMTEKPTEDGAETPAVAPEQTGPRKPNIKIRGPASLIAYGFLKAKYAIEDRRQGSSGP